jgi:hypothetical protein
MQKTISLKYYKKGRTRASQTQKERFSNCRQMYFNPDELLHFIEFQIEH